MTFERCSFTGAVTQLVSVAASGARILFRNCSFYDPAGSLAAYTPADGRLLASLPAGTGHWSSPIVADGVVALPVGDANDHATTGEIDLYAR